MGKKPKTKLSKKVDNSVSVPDPQEDAAYKIMLAKERETTYRWFIVSAAIIAGLYIFKEGFVQVYGSNPNWQKVVITLGAAALAAFGPGVAVARLLITFKAWKKNSKSRESGLEGLIDFTRSSSDINEDGTHKDD